MNGMLWFSGAVERDPSIDVWLNEQAPELGAIAHKWFVRMRECGGDVQELMHDGYPIACEMRHVKVKPGADLNFAALSALIDAAYADIKSRLEAE